MNIEGRNIEIDSLYMKNTSFISSLSNIYISEDSTVTSYNSLPIGLLVLLQLKATSIGEFRINL